MAANAAPQVRAAQSYVLASRGSDFRRPHRRRGAAFDAAVVRRSSGAAPQRESLASQTECTVRVAAQGKDDG